MITQLKRKTLLSILLASGALLFAACENDNEFEEAADDVGDATEDAAESTGDAVEEAGENVRDAAD